MKICLFTENYIQGGVDTFLKNILESWPNKEDEFVLLINYNHPSIRKFSSIQNVKLKIVEYNYLICESWFNGGALQKLENSFVLFAYKLFIALFKHITLPYYVFRIYFLLKDYKNFALMSINGGYPGSLFCRLASIIPATVWKKRVIHNFHSHAILKNNSLSLIDLFLDFYIKNRKIYFVSVSKSCIESLKRRLNCFEGNYKTISNGIKDPFPNLRNIPKNRKKKEKYLLMLATFHAYKGHEFLLKSFKNLLKLSPDVKLKIFGDGSESDRNRILRMIEELGFINEVELNHFKDDVHDLISNALVVVVPSQKYESFGYVIIEAFSRFVPVVATNVGGIPEVLEHEKQGFISNPDDTDSFGNYLFHLVTNEKLNQSMGDSGRKRFLHLFQADKMAVEYYELLLELNKKNTT